MDPNNDDSRRNRDRLDDNNNPFIAFRRFADSQVSSLLNTVFTLPTTISNYRNVHVAREQCLFGRADKEKCKELHEIEEQTHKLLAECRDMYRAGNVEGALAKGDDLLHLNYAADMLRKQIVENGRGSSALALSETQEGTREDLIERVANQKGQQWGWSWDWGFPRPFDAEEGTSNKCDGFRRRRYRHGNSASHDSQAEERREESGSREWPLEAERWTERQMARHDFHEMLLPLFQELLGGEEATSDTRDISPENPSLVTEMARAAGVPRDAYEDLLRTQNGRPLMPAERLGQSDHLSPDAWGRRFWDEGDRCYAGPSGQKTYPKRVPWEGEETAEEPNYEYSHDHEDQHDEPPSPKAKQEAWSPGMPETELEAYERVLGPATPSNAPVQPEKRPSVLSTLTTTERTVAPDGTVTTKVVLKKRFADGREESSETVHTQRGQEDGSPMTERWPQQQDIGDTRNNAPDKPNNGKKSGWFWSS